MATTALLILVFVAANLPFLSERKLLLATPGKHLGWRVLEIILLYFILGGIAYWAEARMGPVHQQNWEFYAVTVCLFLVFAFPGFVYRYLWRRKGL